jgi:hypothetical protein
LIYDGENSPGRWLDCDDRTVVFAKCINCRGANDRIIEIDNVSLRRVNGFFPWNVAVARCACSSWLRGCGCGEGGRSRKDTTGGEENCD